MKRKPVKASSGIFTKGMTWRIIYQGIMIGLLSLWAIGASAMLMLVILAIPVLRAIFSIPVLPMDRIVETMALVIAPVVIVEIFKLLKINTSKDE